MRDQAIIHSAHAVDSRHGFAILLMVLGSVAISFGGLVQRSIEVDSPWQINVYRSFGLIVAIATIVALQNRGRFFATLLSVGRFGTGFGNLMALGTAFCFAGYAVVVRYRRQVEMLPSLLIASALIIIISIPVTSGELALPLNDILLCLFWGGCLSGFVNWTFIIASRHLTAAEVTLLMLIEFSLGPIWVWWFVGETPNHWTLVGGCIIITSVAVRAILELINQSKYRG